MFLESKNKDSILKMSNRVPEVKKIIQLCSDMKYWLMTVKILKLK